MSKLKSMPADELVEDFKKIINMIDDGDLSVNPNGSVTLPNDYRYLSDSGECFVIEFNNETAVEFFLYRGFLNSGSKSYVYTTNKFFYGDYIDTDKYDMSYWLIVENEITTNLFLCSGTG